jgi:Uma2 family endonuclease
MIFGRLAGMNEIPRQPRSRPTTQAAEGVPRLRWTVAEFERLAELGIFSDEDRIELIGGELVPMSPKGNRHEVVCGALHNCLRRNLPDDIDYHPEPGWRADVTNYYEPDFVLAKKGFSRTSVRPEEIDLVIEVAHSSLRFDTTIKANTYAVLGVREYWVVNAQTLTTRVYREPSAKGYGSTTNVPPNEPLVPLLIPSLAVRLAELSVE